MLGNGPRQAIGLGTWIRPKDQNRTNQVSWSTHERIAPLTWNSPCEDYRIKGRDRLKTMTLDAAEFIRRFLLHVLPNGFHRIRHYGLFAGTVRARNIERARQALAAVPRARLKARR